MAEFINRDNLQKSMDFVTNDMNCPLHIAAYIDQIIAQEPAADVEEVRHGRWVFNGAKTYCDESIESVFFCSKCRRNVAVHTDMWTDAEQYAAVIYPYCHCGAKMYYPTVPLEVI